MVEVATPAAPPVGTPAAAPAPPPAVTPPPPPADGDRSWVPDDLKEDATLKNFKTPHDAIRAFVATKKLVGQRLEGMVKVPGDGATPEEVTAWRKATGVPDAVADYTLDVAEDLRHLVPTERLGEYAAVFHELGVPKGTAQKIVSRYAENMQKQLLALEQTYAQQRAALRKEWGEETYTRRETLADRWIKGFVSEEDQQFLQRAGIAGHPFWLKPFSRLGENAAEDGISESDVSGIASNQQMDVRVKEIETNLLWLQGKPPRRAAWTEERTRLIRLLNPEPIR